MVEFIDAADTNYMNNAVGVATEARDLVPITSLLETRRAGGKLDAPALERVRVPEKLKVSAGEAASQFFREQQVLV